MNASRTGQIAVIFVNRRTGEDEEGYAEAAAQMNALAARQPGYCGIDSVRGANGEGITISYWDDEGSAKAWRNHPEHGAIRDQGRAEWYENYEVAVAQIERSYSWQR